MAEDDPLKHGRPDPKPEASSADLLFQEGATAKPSQETQGLVAPAAPGSADIFALADGHTIHDRGARASGRPSGAPARERARSPREATAERAPDQLALDPATLVEEVWTRRAEWGPTVFLVGCWLVVILWAVYFEFQYELYQFGFISLFVGAIVAILLCYPIFITLERPVRMTPEQAVRDYYGALAHHVPHFRRMWLLLSTVGRISTAYGSLEGFTAYWKDRLTYLREGRVGSFTPLVFEVADFRADKSGGKIRIDAEYTLKIWIRGQRKAGTIHVIPMRIVLVRGPDNMWYLEDGTLGRETRSTTQPRR